MSDIEKLRILGDVILVFVSFIALPGYAIYWATRPGTCDDGGSGKNYGKDD